MLLPMYRHEAEIGHQWSRFLIGKYLKAKIQAAGGGWPYKTLPSHCLKVQHQVGNEQAHHAKNSTACALHGCTCTLKGSTEEITCRSKGFGDSGGTPSREVASLAISLMTSNAAFFLWRCLWQALSICTRLETCMRAQGILKGCLQLGYLCKSTTSDINSLKLNIKEANQICLRDIPYTCPGQHRNLLNGKKAQRQGLATSQSRHEVQHGDSPYAVLLFYLVGHNQEECHVGGNMLKGMVYKPRCKPPVSTSL